VLETFVVLAMSETGWSVPLTECLVKSLRHATVGVAQRRKCYEHIKPLKYRHQRSKRIPSYSAAKAFQYDKLGGITISGKTKIRSGTQHLSTSYGPCTPSSLGDLILEKYSILYVIWNA
jgi:hypothetical protein